MSLLGRASITMAGLLSLFAIAAPQAVRAVSNATDATEAFPAFTQTTASSAFSSGTFQDASISDIASALRAGTVSPSDLPINVLDRGEGLLGFDTRSMLALRQANVPLSDWTLIDQTGSEPFESILSQRLAANGLTNAGTDTAADNRGGAVGKLVGRCAMTIANTYRTVWVMPFKSQEFSRGPELVQKSGRAELRLDYETRTGAYAWKTVRFTGVSAVAFTAWPSCTSEQVSAYDRVVEVEASDWIRSLRGLPDGIHHFRVFFDDIGCYEVAAEGIDVGDGDDLGAAT